MLKGRHYQNAYVTRNVDKAIDGFRARGDIVAGTSFLAEVEIDTPAGRGKLTNKLAFLWINGIQYELIEPISGMVDIYKEVLPEGDALRFHHICMRIENLEEFQKVRTTQTLPIVQEGGSDRLKFFYTDARSILGHYVEYVWMTPQMWKTIGGTEA